MITQLQHINKKSLDTLNECSREFFGNLLTHDSISVKTKRLMEESRKTIAKMINVSSDEIIFTESNNIALQSLLNQAEPKLEIIVSKM